jgi:hypothetical protein
MGDRSGVGLLEILRVPLVLPHFFQCMEVAT